jgi:hypothetical protein
VFDDALHGRAERYREWLDRVPDAGELDDDRLVEAAPRATELGA